MNPQFLGKMTNSKYKVDLEHLIVQGSKKIHKDKTKGCRGKLKGAPTGHIWAPRSRNMNDFNANSKMRGGNLRSEECQ